MKKILKFIGILLATLILLGILAIVCIVTFVSPSRFKPIITEQVLKYTGRQLTIDGDLSWSFFPYLGLKVEHLELSNPSGFQEKTFVEIDRATVGVKLLPIFYNRIESSGIVLSGMKLHLIKNADGKTNWTFQTATKTSTNQPAKKVIFGLAISGLDISNANITWDDLQSKQSVNVDKFDLHTKNLSLLKPFPIEVRFDFATTNSVISGHAAFTSQIVLNLEHQVYSLRNMNFSAQVQQDGENIKLNGGSGDLNFSATPTSVSVEGKFKINAVQAKKIKLSNVNVPLRLQNGILNLSPVTANLYQGTLQSNAKINLNSAEPKFDLQGKLTNVQAEPLLQDLSSGKSKLKFSGTGNVDLQITTAGTSSDAMLKNLNGTSRINFYNGTLQGVDIGYLIDTASALANKQAPATQNTGKTEFGNLAATAVIRNGVISNNDLVMSSPRFDTKGSGTINLISQQINYLLKTSIKQASAIEKNNLFNLYGLAIPIQISGDISDPRIRLDTDVLLKAAANQQIQKARERVQEKIQEKLQKQIPGDAGKLLQDLLNR